jgi:hypothetical protein
LVFGSSSSSSSSSALQQQQTPTTAAMVNMNANAPGIKNRLVCITDIWRHWDADHAKYRLFTGHEALMDFDNAALLLHQQQCQTYRVNPAQVSLILVSTATAQVDDDLVVEDMKREMKRIEKIKEATAGNSTTTESLAQRRQRLLQRATAEYQQDRLLLEAPPTAQPGAAAEVLHDDNHQQEEDHGIIADDQQPHDDAQQENP